MQPQFIDGARGRLFSLYLPPAAAPARGGVLFFAAFAEEMNKSRRMVALSARALAAHGYGVLLLDPYGTGDSAGDFADADWDVWLEDYLCAAALLRERAPGRQLFWGMRCGALTAAACLARQPSAADGLLLWQPVLSGELAMTQFLRLRLAASLRDEHKETTASLRAQLLEGISLEIAGYELSPALYAALSAQRLDVGTATLPIRCLEIAADAERPLSPALARCLDAWRAAGIDAAAQSVVGDMFWSTQEIATVPGLAQATVAAIDGLCA
ncbi:hydrolase 2, exosortase A system-associated [Plasticicumulans acidivorans]|uniref:Exosortase A-associated hydrolase 2 n=1 Tax=Plasticicumulans acidivorans TaxID=886464 RepID=A0A317MXV4_9GAMM|nr:hydrolase 2, exosortase A system-associated [Plasticicumulans acidivorans]PWV63358.1 exosortase A-associated hydrolase 2 [Plasticicumulans acidivorans]